MIGDSELLLLVLLFLVLFGGKRLPEFARTLGRAVAEFKKAAREFDEPSGEHGKKLAG
jgi:sec-independent protein translocase protein TatA